VDVFPPGISVAGAVLLAPQPESVRLVNTKSAKGFMCSPVNVVLLNVVHFRASLWTIFVAITTRKPDVALA